MAELDSGAVAEVASSVDAVALESKRDGRHEWGVGPRPGAGVEDRLRVFGEFLGRHRELHRARLDVRQDLRAFYPVDLDGHRHRPGVVVEGVANAEAVLRDRAVPASRRLHRAKADQRDLLRLRFKRVRRADRDLSERGGVLRA